MIKKQKVWNCYIKSKSKHPFMSISFDHSKMINLTQRLHIEVKHSFIMKQYEFMNMSKTCFCNETLYLKFDGPDIGS